MLSDRRDRGKYREKYICSNEYCPWKVIISTSRGKSSDGLWRVNCVTSCFTHAALCPVHTGNTQLLPQQIARLAAFQDVHQLHPTATQLQIQHAVQASHGLRLSLAKIKRARSVHRGLQKRSMTERLQAIPSFLHAFIIKNPACSIYVELYDDNSLECFYVDAGFTALQLNAALPIGFLDAYHFKTLNFNYQILGLTLQDISGSLMIAALAIVPIECSRYWRWFLFKIKQNPALAALFEAGHFMGDRDKGEKHAVEQEFPGASLSACCRHLIPNMREARVYEDRYLWLKVAQSLTREERDAHWQELLKTAPKQAAWLERSLLPHQWQQCEMLLLGHATFGSSTNNIAESTGFKLLVRPVGELSVRERGPADAMRGLCEILCKQSAKKRSLVPTICEIQYTEKAIQLLFIEQQEAMYYQVSSNGPNVFRVQRNNKFRDVMLSQTSEFGAICSCMLPEAWRYKCRHILATQAHVTLLKNYPSISQLWSTDHFKNAFHDQELSMPTPHEIQSAGVGLFPSEIKAPPFKKTRGRPRTKRLRKWFEGLRRKMAKRDGRDPSANVRCCKLCRRAGHDKRTCPARQSFSSQTMAKS